MKSIKSYQNIASGAGWAGGTGQAPGRILALPTAIETETPSRGLVYRLSVRSHTDTARRLRFRAEVNTQHAITSLLNPNEPDINLIVTHTPNLFGVRLRGEGDPNCARYMPPTGLPRPDEKTYDAVIASLEASLDG